MVSSSEDKKHSGRGGHARAQRDHHRADHGSNTKDASGATEKPETDEEDERTQEVSAKEQEEPAKEQQKSAAGHGSSQVDVLEKGEIFFFYRPKVENENPESLDDVQRLYLVLRPDTGKRTEMVKQSHESGKESLMKGKENEKGGDDAAKEGDDAEKGRRGGEGEEKVNILEKGLYRFIVLGRKSLPDPSKRTRPFWGFVELVTSDIADIVKALGPNEYETATRGTRHQPAARAVGEGVCCILKHKKGNQVHTHLAYRLELPKEPKAHSPQEELNIEKEASFIIQIKNPNQPTPANAGLGNKRQATYPASLQGTMGHYRFVSADPCDFLNYEGCEFILISASDDIEKELGVHLDVEHDESCSELVKLFKGKNENLDVKPLLKGEWD